MKKVLFVGLIVVSLTGCAFLSTQKSNAQACLADPACTQEAFAKADKTGTTAGQLAGMSGLPWATTIAKPVVSYGSLLVFLCVMGAALKKKQAV